MKGRRYITALLTAFLLLTTFSFVREVSANVPNVLQIENISQDSLGKIKLQISHLGPSQTHYVDMVEVSVDGQVSRFNLTAALQTSNQFTTELSLGQLQGTPNVKTRAHCTLHGWGDWSTQIQVSEFAEAFVTIFVVLIGSLLVTRVTKRSFPDLYFR